MWVKYDCLEPPPTHTLASISTICRGLGNTDSPGATYAPGAQVQPGPERLISKHRPDSSLHSHLFTTSLMVPLHCLVSLQMWLVLSTWQGNVC